MKIYKYGYKEKLKFYLGYFYYKILLFRDVKKGRMSLYLAEGIWFLNRVFKCNIGLPKFLKRNYFETKYGVFYIHPDLLSTIAISPAFEREDINYLVDRMNESVEKGKKILFLDIGAFVGLYSVLVGNRFKKYNKLDIVAFEPSTDYLSEPTLNLLKKNIKINKLKNIKVKNIGVGSKMGHNKGGIRTNTLKGILGDNFANKYDDVYIKLDIDDFVIDGLKGILSFVNNSKSTKLFIEDFIVRKKVIDFLKKNGFSFDRKITEYNSFWFK